MNDRAETVAGPLVPWDIVRVAFPYADRETSRHRPALVIAAPNAPAEFSLVWLLMITSAGRGLWPGDVSISDLALGGLSRPCVVRTSKVTTLDTRLAERIGRLGESVRVAVAASLENLLKVALAGR